MHVTKERTLPHMKQPLLQHESVRTTSEAVRLGSTAWYHLSYTTGFAPTDFHHFPRLKENLTGQLYSSYDEVKTDVELRIRHQNSQFFHDGLMRLTEICRKRVDCKNGYVEN
jgi:hypothetical protein